MSDVQNGPDWWRASDGKWYPPQSQPGPPPPAAPPIAPPPGAPPSAPPTAPPPGAPPAYGAPPIAPPPGPPPAYGAPPAGPPPSYGAQPPYGASPVGLVAGAPARVSSGLSGTLQGFCWATGALALISAFTAFGARSALSDVGTDDDFGALVDWADLHDSLGGVTAFTGFLAFVVFVLIIIWAYKAHTVSRRLWSGSRTWSSGWAIGAWFIPVGNAILPKLVLDEVEKIATAPRTFDGSSAGPGQGKTSGIGWAWWVLLVLGVIITGVGAGLVGDDESVVNKLFDDRKDDILTGYAVQGLGLLLWAVSCIFGALYIRRLTRRLNSAG